jgi:outer membrane protein OmpA-like peptidoglycan-associated protein
MMKDNPELNFSVEGHTDSDGDNSLNQSLSDQRAKAVMNQLISMGIAENRLKYKGWGETKPMSDNTSYSLASSTSSNFLNSVIFKSPF